jgi:hypothetical protein
MKLKNNSIGELKLFHFLALTIFTIMAAQGLDAVWKVFAFMMIIWAIPSINGLKTLGGIRRGVEALTGSSRVWLEDSKKSLKF